MGRFGHKQFYFIFSDFTFLFLYFILFYFSLEMMKMLRSTPPGVNMDMGKGYDDNDWLRRSSLSQRFMW